MKTSQRSPLVKHLSGGELDQAIADVQKADETVRLAANLRKFRFFDDASGENVVH